MKRYIPFLSIAGLLLFTGLVSPDEAETDERIRRKVENLAIDHALNKNFEVYAVHSIRAVYLNRTFEPVWTDESKINAFISVLEKSHEEGLTPSDYHLEDIKQLRKARSKDAEANLDIVLTDAFLLYISHMLSGKTNPVTLKADWHVRKTDRNPVQYVERLEQQSISQIITDIQPNNAAYRQLKRKLRYLKSLENKEEAIHIPKGEMLRPGTSDSRVPLVREKLIAMGDVTPYAWTDSLFYDDTLKAGVALFQSRYGLEAQGNIGNQTVDAMNMPTAEKIKTVEVNMERWRWMPLEFSNYYIMVNIANFELNIYKNNALERTHRAIVGRPYRKTPVFGSTMQYLVFNPTWTIPPGILRNDVIPEVRKNISYLAEKNISVLDRSGNKLDVTTIDWSNSSVFGYTYRQEPGKLNALGAVKFMFPNQYHVYLHDTPSRALFGKTERAFSSGCIRVENPLELAEYLLDDPAQWSSDRIKKVIDQNNTRTVVISNKPDIYLIYLTTWVDANNRLHFRNDIYDRDRAVYKALHEKPVYDLN